MCEFASFPFFSDKLLYAVIMENLAYLIGFLIGLGFGLGIMVLLGAVFLKLMTLWVIKLKLPYWSAALTVLLASLATFGFNFVMGFIFGFVTQSAEGANMLGVFLLPFSFLLQSWVFSARIPTTFGKACLISLGIFGIYVAIALVFGILAAVVFALAS